jgi:AraC-like DNA-binding protein
MQDLKLGTTSIPPILQYLDCAKSLKLNTDTALSDCHFPIDKLNDDSARIDGSDFQNLLSQLIQQYDNSSFGLQSSQHVEPASYVVLGYITMNCRTISEAMDKIIPYERLVGDMGTTSFEHKEQCLIMSWHCNYTDPEVIPHMVDNVLASWVEFTRWLANSPSQSPKEVLLTRSKPDNEHVELYQQIFRCPIRFNQDINALVIEPHILEQPLRRPDPILLNTLEQHAQLQLNELSNSSDIINRVVMTLTQLMSKGMIPRKERLAEELNTSPRTLQRKLQQAETSYQELLDRVRYERSQHYLSYSQLSIQQIADSLGFSDTRSFHRSFKSWSGTTPGDFRQKQQN